jgi:Na+/melibiose symporter-like transporter
LGAIIVGVALLLLFVRIQKRSTHPSIDVNLFRIARFSAGTFTLAMTFFGLMGSTFYLTYFMQAVRGYTPLAAGVALIPVAVAVMICAPQTTRLSIRFGPRVVTSIGTLIFAASMGSYSLVSAPTPQWVIEVLMFAMGAGMGLTLAPATNAIMSAVPRDKAGAGSAVNNTVRQVAGALGVAVLGSILAVGFRAHLGSGEPARVAAALDSPAAVVSQLPANARVSTYVRADSSESIGNALEFAASARQALEQRAKLPQAQSIPAAQQAANAAKAKATIEQFLADSRSSFVSSMHVTTLFAALAGLLAAIVAFRFLPTRRELAALRGGPPAAPGGSAAAPGGDPVVVEPAVAL